jgi:glycolate oxidase FAD binding subunit
MSVVASLVGALRSELAVVEEPGAWPETLGTPEAVAHPSTIDEVAATMRWAGANGVGVAIVASGDRFMRSREIDRPFVVMRTDRLSGIETYEPADLTLTAKAGTPLRTVATELAANGQWLPYDPPHVNDRSLGGLVATGESGPLWMGYGDLRNHVLGLTLVTGDGRTLELGGRVVKNVAGFDLLKPVVGSRGRLGVIASICVRAFPRPMSERLLTLGADSVDALLPTARAVGSAPVMPVSSVLLTNGRRARLLIRLHGAEATVEADQRTLERHCGVTFARETESPAGELRDHAATGDVVLLISVLPSRLGDALGALAELEPDALTADTYRGSVRAVINVTAARAAGRLRARVEALGGALSARVARGIDADVAVSAVPPPAAALTKRLEAAFDPEGVLWPCRP